MEGVMVLTINVGDLELLHTFSSHTSRKGSDEGPTPSQFTGFAVLVDGHEGDREGTILQHPFFSEAGAEPHQDSSFRFQIDPSMLKRLKETGTYRYQDPIAQDPRGDRYAGEWIAAMERVEVSRRSVDDFERRQSTSLLLLIQVPASSITGPVAVMSQKLSGLFLAALLALLTAIVALWIFVLRYMRLPDSFAEAARARSDSSEAKSGSGLDGLPSPVS
jgi:hypothetical protein